MPTRKQRRRRDKSFRHEYETVLVDAEGNELPVEPDEPATARGTDAKSRSQQTARGSKQPAKGRASQRRPPRPVAEPSWNRALKRGGLMGAGMFVLFVFVLHGGSQAGRALTATIYAVMFVPLTYFADRFAYRAYIRRSGGAPGKPDGKPKR
jgi:hypothetical protein